jgi:hypothetical protein
MAGSRTWDAAGDRGIEGGAIDADLPARPVQFIASVDGNLKRLSPQVTGAT